MFGYIDIMIRNWMVLLDDNFNIRYSLELMLIGVLYPIGYTFCCLDMNLAWLKYVDRILFLVNIWCLCMCTIMSTIYWTHCFYLGSQDVWLKTCSIIYLVTCCLGLILMYFPGRLELDITTLVELFEVYTLLKTICILIGVCHCAKRMLIEFLTPWIEVDNWQILGIFLSWKIFWVRSNVVWMLLNQLGWMIHIFWLG